jgi:hypothetical protein
VTLDESRSVLPPVTTRPPVYTYYDGTLDKDEDVKAAKNNLLLTWRRAWWAQGFKPVILGPADTMRNPRYEVVQKLGLQADFMNDMSRWLAWEYMGAGVLCHYTALPMGSHEDVLLSYLRRRKGDYPGLSRFESLAGNFFSGPKQAITLAIDGALDNPDHKESKTVLQVVPSTLFEIDKRPEGIAVYDDETIKTKYGKVHEAIVESPAKGLAMLDSLINSHLHNTWQNVFSSGIAVLKPHPEHMSAIVEPAVELADSLAQCSESPLATSCPPNIADCKYCIASMPLKVGTPAHYRNTSTLFTIGTVPHPYTFAALKAMKDNIDIPYIRRNTDRDAWLRTATQELLGTGVSGGPRVLKFKEAVASPYGIARSIWFTAERPHRPNLEWHFGFAIPHNATSDGKSETPVPGPERRPPPKKHDHEDGPEVTEENLVAESSMLLKAQAFCRSKNKEHIRLKEAIEAWNLADTEAWRFARAFLARSRLERKAWEEEEQKAAGGLGLARNGGKRGWATRWYDSNDK